MTHFHNNKVTLISLIDTKLSSRIGDASHSWCNIIASLSGSTYTAACLPSEYWQHRGRVGAIRVSCHHLTQQRGVKFNGWEVDVIIILRLKKRSIAKNAWTFFVAKWEANFSNKGRSFFFSFFFFFFFFFFLLLLFCHKSWICRRCSRANERTNGNEETKKIQRLRYQIFEPNLEPDDQKNKSKSPINVLLWHKLILFTSIIESLCRIESKLFFCLVAKVFRMPCDDLYWHHWHCVTQKQSCDAKTKLWRIHLDKELVSVTHLTMTLWDAFALDTR